MTACSINACTVIRTSGRLATAAPKTITTANDSAKEKDVLPLKDGEVLVVDHHRYLKNNETEPPRFVVVHSSPEVGLDLAGEQVGVVTDVRHHGQDLLVIEPAVGSHRRSEILVPFVAAIAVDVDVAGGRMVIDPPAGLLDLGS